MPKKNPNARSSVASRLCRTFLHSLVRRGWRSASDLELGSRSLGFAALGFLTLVPLLLVISSADQERGRGLAQWLGEALGLSSTSGMQVEELFARPDQVLRTTTAFGIATLALFGLPFGTVVQTGYEKVWSLPPAHWHARWRHAVWLGGLVGYLFVSATTGLWRGSSIDTTAASLSAVLFFWWSQRFLLSGRVRWGALLIGAVVTVIGLLGLRVFSRLVFSPLIASSAVSYGSIGTVLVLQSWLVGVGVVVFGGALLGRLLHEEVPRVMSALRRARHRKRGTPPPS
ncbi:MULTISPECIES: ribonuclease BN [unclassified Streptomyces]|uniref:ribonuclease BN n=1 Tax=unclassified Streptomyces TaxID=2593676 RepID=UPI002DD8CB17|nr:MULTISPECIES: ribonuclease BN [unclassified Streptomyces]WSA93361.1 YihY/virulence factor BrkB family protein [Streptomyces sp. NBC_01795]WSB77728.1 YihY/virulence factor BrkB family protein [Streptomyces sp. NBC_01775]WSS14023.1 YihY/virulence factor BrkB family protein [Streptomyces sp. NBC_01186]WSS42842.1 YihY/virulence factor BrkB family protein [Streptomyces sp. NBC_01187]